MEERVPPPDIPIESWLQGPDQNSFDWKIEVGQPYLTFQQRYQVSMVASFRVDSLYKAGLSPLDLHFVTKFAGEDGRWLPGQSYSRFKPPANLAHGDQIRSVSTVYAKPGVYRIAVIAYDRLHQKGNLWRGTVRVPAIHRDPLSTSDKDLPAVEFLQTVPAPTGTRGLLALRDPWDLGHGNLSVPVSNGLPVQVDIVANIALSAVTRGRHSEAPEWFYTANAANVIEVSRALSEMDLKSGCILLSTLDISRQEVLFDRVNTGDFDWSKVGAALRARERNKIDVHTLAGEKKTSAFLVAYLTKLAESQPVCRTPEGRTPVRVLIVVSDNFLFPSGTETARLRPTKAWDRSYYVELVPVAGPRWDEIGALLKPLNPLKLETPTPIRFRAALAKLVQDIERLSGHPTAAP